jgi:hypothetical protein
LLLLVVAVAISCGTPSRAQECDATTQLQNYTGGGQIVCPCFAVGEEAGAVLFPSGVTTDSLEILRVGIGWGSQFGGTSQTLEQAIHVYGAGLPNPGSPVYTLPGPQLNDGFINEFNLEAFGGPVRVANGPFTVTLEFLNPNASDIFAPSMVHDGNGCRPGRNVVLVNGSSWSDACVLGVTGDWIVYAVIRPLCRATAAPQDELIAANRAVFLGLPYPNPVAMETSISYVLRESEAVDIGVYDVRGRKVATLVEGSRNAGSHMAVWDGRDDGGRSLPAGTYFIALRTPTESQSRRVTLMR